MFNCIIGVIKLFPCSTQKDMNFIRLINVKTSTIIDILTFVSMINTIESLEAIQILGTVEITILSWA